MKITRESILGQLRNFYETSPAINAKTLSELAKLYFNEPPISNRVKDILNQAQRVLPKDD